MSGSALADLMTHAAAAFLDSLSPAQLAAATREFGDEAERRRWYYTPNARPGVSLIELNAPQQQLARQLLRSGLSERAYNTAATIMGLEAILASREGWRPGPYTSYPGPSPSVVRDPAMYFVCVFGQPGSPEAWGWAFGGHHISVHHTVVSGRVARPTPSFFGAHPANAPLGAGHWLRPLAPEQDLGLELLHALDGAQKRIAVLGNRAPVDVMQANRPQVQDGAEPYSMSVLMGLPKTAAIDDHWEARHQHTALGGDDLSALRFAINEPRGLAIEKMSPPQREIVHGLVRRYVDRLPEILAEAEWARLEGGLRGVHFAWAGGQRAGEAHYYRLHGPGLLIEYDNADADGDHIHAVWRDPDADFGGDLLRAHYAAAH